METLIRGEDGAQDCDNRFLNLCRRHCCTENVTAESARLEIKTIGFLTKHFRTRKISLAVTQINLCWSLQRRLQPGC